MTVVEYEDQMVVIDVGLAFPEDEMLGVDIVIPDFSYVIANKDRLRGILITHGHEDHAGGLPYLLREVDAPVFATRLTMGMIRAKLREFSLTLHDDSREVTPGKWMKLGVFRIKPFRVTHSIPDAVGYALETPVGVVVHTGDYKFDQTPVDNQPTDYATLAQLGRNGVLVLLGDSTNAERPGITPSEREVGLAIDEIMMRAPGRVFLATFASNIHRLQQVITSAAKFKRKVAVVGRSMENTVRVARDLGYLRGTAGVLVDLDHLRQLPPHQCVILTTGSQGEPMSALTRLSTGEFRKLEIGPGDTVVVAATPVPGNEKFVHRTLDNLFRLGAKVIYGRDEGVHVSGHGSREEIKLMINLLRPRYLVPIHGEYRHLICHAQLGREVGIPEERILIGQNGDIFGFDGKNAELISKVPAGAVLVDGLGVGDVGQVVLRDRKQLAEDGILIVVIAIDKDSGEVRSGPEIISRGFVYMRESEDLLDDARSRVIDALAELKQPQATDWTALKNAIREALTNFLYQRTHRRPMILPIVMEV